MTYGYREDRTRNPRRTKAPTHEHPGPRKDDTPYPIGETPTVLRPCSCGRLHAGGCCGRREEGRA